MHMENTMPPDKKNEITQEKQSPDEPARIVVTGDISGAEVEALESRLLAEAAWASKKPVTLDLNAVTKIDARGISLCIGLKKECDIAGCALTLEMNQELFKTFKMLDLVKYLGIQEACDA